MVSDKQLLVVLRSRRVVALWGDLVRASIAGAVLVVIALYLLYFAALMRFMSTDLHMNDFGKFYYSAQMFLAGEDMYGPSPATAIPISDDETRQFWNMNPPHFHLLVLPLARLSPASALGIWMLGGGLSLVWCLLRIGRELRFRWNPTRMLWTALAIVVCSASAMVVVTGQLTFLLLLPVSLSWIAARRGHLAKAGAYMGLVAGLKPFLGIFFVYWLVRRQWRAAAAMTVTVLTMAALGLAIFGVDAYAAWVRALSSVEWSWAHMNASVTGIVARAFGTSPRFEPVALVPALVVPLSAFLSAGVAVLTIASVVTDRTEHAVDRSYVTLIAGALLTSPLGWMYYLPLLGGPALALVRTMNARPSRMRNALAWLAVPGFLLPAMVTGAWEGWPWAGPTVGSIYAWTTLLVWASALVDRQADRPRGYRPSGRP